ncbi:hypothetical protein V5O48_013571 [Marasmius crinis-equi]|uniref:Uncharacterized protein n=1 Tax=Marasmius crinis-equi TaxID=585013 RepID=A0ABR3EZP6_9AGAR
MLSPLYYMTTVAALNTRYSLPSDSLLPTTHGDSGSFVNDAPESSGLANFRQKTLIEDIPFKSSQRPEETLTPFTLLHPVEPQVSEKACLPVKSETQNITPEVVVAAREAKVEGATQNSLTLRAEKAMVQTKLEKRKEAEVSARSLTPRPLRRLPVLPAQ